MKFLFTLLILGQIIMATTLQKIDINGTNVPIIFEEDKRLPIVTLQFIFQNSGSITDINKAGLAKFSSKIMNEGTATLGSSAFAELLESKAIHITASVGKETFVIELSCLIDQYDEALNYLKMLLKDPNYTQEAIKKVKTTTIGSLSAKENNFDYVASNELKELLYKGTPLAKPSEGTLKSVSDINLQDVETFLKSHLVSSKLIVVIGGDIDIDKTKEKITKIVEEMPKGKFEQLTHYETSSKAKEKVLIKETKQAYIYFGSPYNMKIDNRDYYKARVAMFILGAGGFGSRLMEEIRVKRGLAYSAYASVSVSKSSSSMKGYLQTKLDKLDEAKKAVVGVISKFVKNGVTEDELEQTKKFLLGSEPLRVETMSQRLNRTFMDYYQGYKLGHSEKELKLINDLTLKELNEFIKKHKEILNISFAIVTK